MFFNTQMGPSGETRPGISRILPNPPRYGRQGTLAIMDDEHWIYINELSNHLWKLGKSGGDMASIIDVISYAESQIKSPLCLYFLI